ncbi:uncharacterized protein E0L32_007732 [Thyridium curvatum]|uniref:non-specific serine/threonine protein kinase n=1 Tax=Thyridium curvatum TaxID=1093900 RepID=A0A507B380_9PEZI|nr:uncharacterized protein E0L32_007732 [Thyridium curvatum]TPX11521.1 hypothetical protein E0L32_007732 [Thyridium curvatum]
MLFDFHRAHSDYHRWVTEVCEQNIGVRISPVALLPTGYVPLQELRNYWDQTDLVRPFALGTNGSMLMDESNIIGHYLRIFATLVYISTPQDSVVWYLDNFARKDRTDAKLPFHKIEDLDDIFGTTDAAQRVKTQFYKSHFRFSPQQLAEGTNPILNNTELAGEVILPLKHRGKVQSGTESEADLELFEFSSSSGLQARTTNLVAKIYPPREIDFTFRSELEAYSALKWQDSTKINSDYFLQYYGSFVQGTRGVILLEYADQGSLLDFFRRGQLPYTREEMFMLWERLSSLFIGLARIHGVRKPKDVRIRGVHQDVKPSNIFVFSDGDATEFRFKFKIGDFGLSSFEKTTDTLDPSLPDHKSTKVYGAPELMSWHVDLDDLDLRVNAEVDMWSLGCVLFETAVWSVCGERGREEFLRLRLEERGHPEARGRFHNGVERLRALDTMTNRLLDRRRCYDNVTNSLCKWICENLLVGDPTNRLNAGQAQYRFEELLRKLGAEAHHDQSNYELARLSMHSPHSSQSYNSPIRDTLTAQPTPPGIHPTPASPQQSSPSPYSPGRTSVYVDHTNNQTTTQRPQPNQYYTAPGSVPVQQDSMNHHYPSENATGLPRASTVAQTDAVTQPRRHTYTIASGPGAATHNGSHFTVLNEGEELPPVESHARYLAHDPAASVAASQTGAEELGTQLNALSISQPQSTTPSNPKLSRNTPQRQGLPDITIQQLLEWKARRRSGQELPEELAGIPNALLGRDQVFLVDNSKSMTKYWHEVQNAIEALGWVVKRVDPDGVELRFTSKPTQKFKSKRSTELLEKVKMNSPQGDTCMMELALSVLIDDLVPASAGAAKTSRIMRALNKPKTGISIYILTNAVWSGKSDYSSGLGAPAASPDSGSKPDMCGVDSAVRTLIDRVHKGRHNRSYVTLQFIRFGHDSVGKRRLSYLDNDISGEWDIVDRRYHERGMRAMIIGAMNENEYPSDDSDAENVSEGG